MNFWDSRILSLRSTHVSGVRLIPRQIHQLLLLLPALFSFLEPIKKFSLVWIPIGLLDSRNGRKTNSGSLIYQAMFFSWDFCEPFFANIQMDCRYSYTTGTVLRHRIRIGVLQLIVLIFLILLCWIRIQTEVARLVFSKRWHLWLVWLSSFLDNSRAWDHFWVNYRSLGYCSLRVDILLRVIFAGKYTLKLSLASHLLLWDVSMSYLM